MTLLKNKKIIAGAIVLAMAMPGGAIMYSSMSAPKKLVSKPQEVKVDNTQAKPVESASIAPETQSTTTVATDTQTAVETPQSAPTQQTTVQTVPTIEELKVQYGWNVMAGGLVEGYANQYPQYFTDQYRQAAFKYMFDVSQEYARKTGADVNAPSSKCYGWYKLYQQGKEWVEIGQTVGIDWNSYIN